MEDTRDQYHPGHSLAASDIVRHDGTVTFVSGPHQVDRPVRLNPTRLS